MFPHTAYYSPKRLLKKDLQKLDPQRWIKESDTKPTEQALKPVLDTAYYKDLSQGYPNKMKALSDTLAAVKHHYAKWRLDTEAFDDQNRFIGLAQPGFIALVAHLVETFEGTTDKLPDLAFIHKDYPPYNTYPFEVSPGKLERRLPLNKEILTELQEIAQGSWAEGNYPDSKVMKFIQAGVNQRGELVLLEPETTLEATK